MTEGARQSRGDLVSVVVPTYNRAGMLGDAIRSVAAQTYAHWELVVVDDGSTDGTGDLVARLADELGDGRIRYFRQEHAGAPASRNRGFEETRGRYLHFLDSDDILDPDMLGARTVALVDAGAEVSFGPCVYETLRDGKPCRTSVPGESVPLPEGVSMLQAVLRGRFVNPSRSVYTRDLLERVGPWDEQLTRAQDTDYSFRIAALQPGIIFSAGAPAIFRGHGPGQITARTGPDVERSLRRVFEKLEADLHARGLFEGHRAEIACAYAFYGMHVLEQCPELSAEFTRRSRELGPPVAPFLGGLTGLIWRTLGFGAALAARKMKRMLWP